MGITGFSLGKLREHGLTKKGQKVLELGCQNLYNSENYGQISNPYFKKLGQEIDSIDLEGCNGSNIINLDNPLPKVYLNKYDVVTNFGTSEHCGDLYQVFKNIHNALVVGGISINENPKAGNWPGHGNFYLVQEFYNQLCEDMSYELLDLGEHAAMGNTKDGWNVYGIYRKIDDRPFVTREIFEKYTYFNK